MTKQRRRWGGVETIWWVIETYLCCCEVTGQAEKGGLASLKVRTSGAVKARGFHNNQM